MIFVKANRVYQLKKTDINNNILVYCIIEKEPNIGVALTSPLDTDEVYSIISGRTAEQAASLLSEKFNIVSFFSSEVLSLCSNINKEMFRREEQPISKASPSIFPSCTHYSRVSLPSVAIDNKAENFSKRTEFFYKNPFIIKLNDNKGEHYIYNVGNRKVIENGKIIMNKEIGVEIGGDDESISAIRKLFSSEKPQTEEFNKLSFVLFTGGQLIRKDEELKIPEQVIEIVKGASFVHRKHIPRNSENKPVTSTSNSSIKGYFTEYRIIPHNTAYILKAPNQNKEAYVFCFAKADYYVKKKYESSLWFGVLLPPEKENFIINAQTVSEQITNEPDLIINKSTTVVTFSDTDRISGKKHKRVFPSFKLPSEIKEYIIGELGKPKFEILPYNKCRYKEASIHNYLYDTNEKRNNCFVKLNDGSLAFHLKNVCFPIIVPFEKSSLTTFSHASEFSINVTKMASPSMVICYGTKDNELATKILRRITLLSKPLEGRIKFRRFFEKLEAIKGNPKVAPLYKRMWDTAGDWDAYNRIVSLLLKYVLDESLLVNTEGQKQVSGSSVPEKVVFDYKTYKGTHGIFYSLKNEEAIFSDGVSLKNIQCRFIKKFAYIPSSNRLSDVLDMLVADVDLVSRTLTTEVYKGKEIKKAVYPIRANSDNFTFNFIPEASEVIRPIINTVALICNTIFKNYEHTASPASRNSHYREPKTPYSGKSEVGVITYRSSFSVREYSTDEQGDKLSSPKGMHFRRGHWHSYWYGPHNSPNRVKKLKWVKETIVNRDSQNIIIEI